MFLNYNTDKFFLYLTFIFSITVFLFGFSSPVKAEYMTGHTATSGALNINLVQQYAYSKGATIIQYFDVPAGFNNIRNIELYRTPSTDEIVPATLFICKGVVDNSVDIEINAQCLGNSQVKILEKYFDNIEVAVEGWHRLTFPDTYAQPAVNYYFSLIAEVGETSQAIGNYSPSVNSFVFYYRESGTGLPIQLDNYDLIFEVNSTPDFEPPGATNIEWLSPDDGVQYSPATFIDWSVLYRLDQATIDLYYNQELAVLIEYVGTNGIVITADQSGLAKFIGTIDNSNFIDGNEYFYSWNNPLAMPENFDYYEATAYLVVDNMETIIDSEVVSFTIGTTSDQTLLKPIETWCSNLCVDLYTASSTVWDNFLTNSLVCGSRNVACWLFTPHTSSIQGISDSYDNIKTVFPFNTFFDLTDTVSNTIESATLNMESHFDIPFVKITAGEAEFYTIPVLDKDSIADLVGIENSELIRTSIAFFIWIFIIFLIYLQLRKT